VAGDVSEVRVVHKPPLQFALPSFSRGILALRTLLDPPGSQMFQQHSRRPHFIILFRESKRGRSGKEVWERGSLPGEKDVYKGNWG
jgi:hypothetical protein